MNNANTKNGFMSHPKPLLSLSFVELWERFSFYGIRPMLVLFMVLAINEGGFGFSKEEASSIYAIFAGSLYLAALPGGYLADKLLGQKLATSIGAVIIAIGNFLLAGSYYLGHKAFFLGLVFIVIGTGLFKTCISLMVGMLYPKNDPKRDSGFTIFYMGINMGSFLAPLICGTVKEHYGYHLGFAISGCGMVLSMLLYYFHTLPQFNKYSKVHKFEQGLDIPDTDKTKHLIYLGTFIVTLALVITLAWFNIITINPVFIAEKMAAGIIFISVLYFIYLYVFAGLDSNDKKKLFIFVVLFIASAFFWSCFEQKPTSFNFFAQSYTNHTLFGYSFPIEWFQSINPFTIIVFAPIISYIWIYFANKNKEVDSFLKFALGLTFAALAFFVMYLAAKVVMISNSNVSPMYIIMCFWLLSIGELCLSPVGLSIMSQIAPSKISSSVMGLWFVSVSLGNVIAGLTGAKVKPENVTELPQMFMKFGISLIAVAILIVIFRKFILKLLNQTNQENPSAAIYKQRVEKLQQILKEKQCDFCIITSSDPHASEYLPEFYKTRANISGFFGSAGTLVVGQKEAILFTDGRYFLQAEKELNGSKIKLNKGPNFLAYLQTNHKNSKIIIDDNTYMYSWYLSLKEDFEIVYEDLASLVYDRGELVCNKVYIQNSEFIGSSSKDKIKLIQEELQKLNAKHHIISSLDDIAYITNLRGSDVECNPVFLAYMVISYDKCTLFIDNKKLNEEINSYLSEQEILIQNYEDIFEYIKTLEDNVLVDYDKSSVKLINSIQSNKINSVNPSTFLKSQKNETEIKHIKQAHIADGVALVKFFINLEKKLASGEKLYEHDIDTLVTQYRAYNENYVCNSFSTIAGFNENAALPHYKANSQNSKAIEKNGILLIDSGAQYQNGTTDITRVVATGIISDEFKKDYTLVLKSHIAIASLVYKEGIMMPLLDVMARSVLWENGLDYMHGTGHGVGYFLNVHEGPQVLSYLAPISEKTAVKKGMLTSIEPGLYHVNKYGIRLENLYISKHKLSSEYGEFLEFENVTMYPFELDLIDKSMLNDKEISWINSYHQKVFDELSEFLNEDEKIWLKAKTRAL